MILVVFGAATNSLFDVRQPAIVIEANVAQLLACKRHGSKLMWK